MPERMLNATGADDPSGSPGPMVFSAVRPP